jgi:hypothetical protein
MSQNVSYAAELMSKSGYLCRVMIIYRHWCSSSDVFILIMADFCTVALSTFPWVGGGAKSTLVFEWHQVQISDGLSAILAENFRVLPQYLRVNSGMTAHTGYGLHFYPGDRTLVKMIMVVEVVGKEDLQVGMGYEPR